jgi:hypothetical protein
MKLAKWLSQAPHTFQALGRSKVSSGGNVPGVHAGEASATILAAVVRQFTHSIEDNAAATP